MGLRGRCFAPPNVRKKSRRFRIIGRLLCFEPATRALKELSVGEAVQLSLFRPNPRLSFLLRSAGRTRTTWLKVKSVHTSNEIHTIQYDIVRPEAGHGRLLQKRRSNHYQTHNPSLWTLEGTVRTAAGRAGERRKHPNGHGPQRSPTQSRSAPGRYPKTEFCKLCSPGKPLRCPTV